MLAVKMGERLGLDPASLRDLAAGGLLHDIGKLHTPDGILKKPGKLTDAEYEVIKRHPADGQRMLREVGRFNERVLHLVEAHHERLDGRGYPFGTDSGRIALEARILAVADVYDALTSHRPYRPAWPPDRALEVIEREKVTPSTRVRRRPAGNRRPRPLRAARPALAGHQGQAAAPRLSRARAPEPARVDRRVGRADPRISWPTRPKVARGRGGGRSSGRSVGRIAAAQRRNSGANPGRSSPL